MFTKDVVNIIPNSLIFSKLFYCSTVWSGTFKQNITKLQQMQNQGTALLVRQETLHLFNVLGRKLELKSVTVLIVHITLFYSIIL